MSFVEALANFKCITDYEVFLPQNVMAILTCDNVMWCVSYLYVWITAVPVDVIEQMENNDRSVTLAEIRTSDKAKSR